MNTDKHDDAAEQFDGGAPTDEEAKLIAQGTDEDPIVDTAAADAAAALAATQATIDAAAAAAAAVPAVIATATVIPEKPAAPMDFAAEREAANEKFNDGDLTPITLQDERERILRAELAHDQQIRDWEAASQRATATAAAAVEADWNTAALAFEASNADFLANPLRHDVMQRAIATVEQKAQAAGETLATSVLLDRALAIAVDYTGYVKPAATTERDAIGKALSERNAGRGPVTLGDAPQAHVDTERGSEAYGSLDALAIPDLEIAFANMSPAQQERYLADAPGATAAGRG